MEFEEDNPKENLTEDPDRQIDSDGIENETSGKNVCQHFLLGKCHFGDRCRLSHSVLDVPVDVPETTQLEEDDTEKQNKTRKNRKKMQTEKKEKPHINEGLEKKSRMRTADDVISRILWDSSVDPADFMVGHLDRFLGVLERPFSDFSWDTQVCDCDFSEELALPRHRIQYFSYKGQRVWDKDSRTDRVFGSTGQSIVPPFGVEDQQQENLTPDTGEQEEAPNLEDVSSDLDRVASECSEEHDNISTTITKSKHELEDAVQHSSNEKAQDGTCNETLLSQNEAAHEDLTQLAKDLSVTQKEGPTEIEEKWKDSWDTVENSEQVSFVLPAPKSYRSPRQPTHFICFRVDSPAALKAFQCVQRKVLSHLPQSEPLWLDPATLHVTLCLLVLNSPEEVSSAAKLMCTTIRNSHKPPISVSFPPKLKHFHGTVLHVAPQPTSDVQSLNSPLQEVFKEKGWLHRHSRCPTYHLTLAKARERMTEKMFEGIGSLKLPKDVNFGKLEVNKLYLCEIGRRRTESSFYEVVCAVQLPNV